MRCIFPFALVVLQLSFVASCLAQDEKNEDSIQAPVPMQEFEVTVIDQDGKPIEGAEVLVNGVRCEEDPGSWYSWPANNGGPMPIVQTDENGFAKFQYPTKLGGGGQFFTITILTMTFRHPRFISQRSETPVDEEAFEQTLAPGCHVTYSAVNEAEEQIKKFGAYISGPGHDAKWTMTDGTIESSAVPDGNWQTMLVAPQEDGVTLFSGILPTRYKSGNDVNIRNITLRPGLRVQGKLADNVPRPVSDGVVVAWSQPKPTEAALEKREAVGWSDVAAIKDDGTFEFASLPRDGRLQLIALCRGWVIKDQPREGQRQGGQIKGGILIDLKSAEIDDGVLANVELPMEETGTVEFTVQHLDGKPAEGITVATSPNQRLEDTGTQLLGQAYPSILVIQSRIEGKELPNYWQQERKSRYMQKTDADGKALIHDLPVGSWGVFVGSDKFKMVAEKKDNENRNRLYREIIVEVEVGMGNSAEVTVEPIK